MHGTHIASSDIQVNFNWLADDNRLIFYLEYRQQVAW